MVGVCVVVRWGGGEKCFSKIIDLPSGSYEMFGVGGGGGGGGGRRHSDEGSLAIV